MTTLSLRDQLRLQLESMPDELVGEVADFAAFILARHRTEFTYADWKSQEWSQFSLDHFFRETDNDVEYTIDDASEVYSQ